MTTLVIEPKFEPGVVVATPGVREIFADKPERYGLEMLRRHLSGDWGNSDPEDKATNDRAVQEGGRIMSAYPIDDTKPCKGWGENCIWIITEADRSVTTFLLPSEY